MAKDRGRILGGLPKTLEERYFKEIRPGIYQRHSGHLQTGVREGRTLAEHFDSACQFILTVSRLAAVPEKIRGVLLAATAVHDLNKLDPTGRKVKTLARDQAFLRDQLQEAGVDSFVMDDADLELVRKLIERHSGHNVTDGTRFLPEDPRIQRWVAMLIAADLFDLGIADQARLFEKIQRELTVALGRPSRIYPITVAEDRGYITALLLGACEQVLKKYGLVPLSILQDGALFEGPAWPEVNLTLEVALAWQAEIDRVFGNNIAKLIRATKDGIKISPQAIQQDPDEILIHVMAALDKKEAGFKIDKISRDIAKWGEEAGAEAMQLAINLGLAPVENGAQFSLSEGLKAAYLSYREAELPPKEAWNKIAEYTGISAQQRDALEAFNAQYGRCLFAVKGMTKGIEGIEASLRDSINLRKGVKSINLDTESSEIEAPEELIMAVSRILNWPTAKTVQSIPDLSAYIEANPRQRCSLGVTTGETDTLYSDNMPPGTKVQMFSNRLPGGMTADPVRRADPLIALSYQLMTVGAQFPEVKKQEPIYLHISLPKGSSPQLLRIWKDYLKGLAQINLEGGPVAVNEFKLYKDKRLEFRTNKVVGAALPRREEFINSTVMIPLLMGDVNTSMALLKSLHLALKLSLATDIRFPFTLSSSLEFEPANLDFSTTKEEAIFARVQGIPSTLQPLLTSNQSKPGHYTIQEADDILERLECIGDLALAVASLQKLDDCIYDLARSVARPVDLYFVLLRWLLREQDDPNLAVAWERIRTPLNTLENSMSDGDPRLTQYLREAAQLAAEGSLRGSSFRRTSQIEPFALFITALRSRKSHMTTDILFAALVQDYHTRLDRIRDHGVGLTKFEQLKAYYGVLRKLYEEVYQGRADKLLADQKTLEAAYLFLVQEANAKVKAEKESTPTPV